MTEEKKKSVEDIFKDAFKPAGQVEGEETEKKPASEMFKDLFTKKEVSTVIETPAPEEEAVPTEEGEVKLPEEEAKLPDKEEAALVEEIGKRSEEKEATVEETEDVGEGDKSVENIFKKALTPKGQVEGEETEDKPASEMFKDLFKPVSTPTKAVEKTPVVKAPEVEAKPEEKPKVPVTDIMKEAHEKGMIDKKTYDQAVQKIVKSSVEGGSLVGEFKVIEKEGKPEIVLDEGEIEIPLGSKVEVLKKDGEISIIVKKGSGEIVEGSIEELERLIEGGDIEIEEKTAGKTGKGFGNMEQMNWLEDYEEEESGIIGEVKDEIELADLRKEFKPKKKEEEEIGEEEVEEEKEPGFLDRILKRVKKTTEESPSSKLKRLSLENLVRMKEIEDERKAIVGVAYVLKEFLEIKYEIPHELTYTELIRELRVREMNNELRGRLITFFKKTAVMVYANTPKIDSFSRVYSLAERTIKELS